MLQKIKLIQERAITLLTPLFDNSLLYEVHPYIEKVKIGTKSLYI